VSGSQDPRHLLTDGLDLRAIAPGDVDALHPLLSDSRNCAHLPEGPNESPAVSRAWIDRHGARWAGNGLGYWTVRLRSSDDVIGVGGAERRPNFWNIYYLLDWRHWGHGYGTELARAARRAATLADADLPLVAWIHEDNAASKAVARHLGLTDYGLRSPEHWDGEPMHYWADRPPPAE
jgi:RimJ/RimL family protein N-acetyltransferase